MENKTAGPPKDIRNKSGASGARSSQRSESGKTNRTSDARSNQRSESGKTNRTPGARSNQRSESGKTNRTPGARSSQRSESGKTNRTPGNGVRMRKDVRKEYVTPKAEADKVRLNKFIANSGICARREADDLIKQGFISVNGKKVTDMGIKVSMSDSVEYRGKKLVPGKKVYILLNKPKGYVTTVKDPHAENTVLDLVRESTTERIYPVGRLDKATTGVLLLTNDGDLAGKLTHPSFGARKVYHVFLDRDVTKHDMETIVEGMELEDGKVSADAISYADSEDHTQVGIELHSGQNRVVRRIFEKLGYRVRKLDRVSFAGLTKKNLQRGHWRHLTLKEISMLKRGIYK